MGIKWITAFSMLCTFIAYADWIPLPNPILTPPLYSERADEEIRHFELRHAENKTPGQLYELALLHIQIENYQKARELLLKTLELDPHFSQALIQLGYLDLWENRNQEAYVFFLKELTENECEKRSCEGLRTIAKKWSYENKNTSESLLILRTLYRCDPNNPDTSLALGNLLVRLNQFDEAESLFKECLVLSPDYQDPALSLANLYLREQKWDQAREIFEQYPDSPEALKGLGRLEIRTGHFIEAESYYKKSLSKGTKDQESRKEYAHTLSSSWKFREALDQYALFLTEDPDNETAWSELLEMKSHTNPALLGNVTYTAAKENDPTLKLPVVKDFYLYSDLHSLIPVSDRLLLDVKTFFYQQKEVDIYIPGINYNADLVGLQLSSRFLFKEYWRWDMYGRTFHAWPNGSSMNYPFKTTTRFEPGTSIIFDSSSHLVYGDLHIESIIIKNFAITKSQVLEFFASELHYLFKPDCFLHPQVEASIKEINLFDGNFEDLETLWLRCGAPFLEKTIIGIYQFQHSHFSELNPNYFSYQNQYCNFVGVNLHLDFWKKAMFDVIYQHNWQLTKKLIQPIGNFLFIANTQLLTGNKITAILSYRLKDQLKFSAEGHYFRNTLPYRDWNLKGSLLWQF